MKIQKKDIILNKIIFQFIDYIIITIKIEYLFHNNTYFYIN